MRAAIRPAAVAILILLIGAMAVPCGDAAPALDAGSAAMEAPHPGPPSGADCHCVCHASSVVPGAGPTAEAPGATPLAVPEPTAPAPAADGRRGKPPRLG